MPVFKLSWRKPIFSGATVTKKCAIFKSLTGTIYSMTIKGHSRRVDAPVCTVVRIKSIQNMSWDKSEVKDKKTRSN